MCWWRLLFSFLFTCKITFFRKVVLRIYMPSLGVSVKRLLALSRASREARTPSAPGVTHAAAILGVHFSEFALAPPHCTILAAAGDLTWSQRANVPSSAPDRRRERAQINKENVVKCSIGNFVESSVCWRCASVRFHGQHSFQSVHSFASQNREQRERVLPVTPPYENARFISQ